MLADDESCVIYDVEAGRHPEKDKGDWVTASGGMGCALFAFVRVLRTVCVLCA